MLIPCPRLWAGRLDFRRRTQSPPRFGFVALGQLVLCVSAFVAHVVVSRIGFQSHLEKRLGAFESGDQRKYRVLAFRSASIFFSRVALSRSSAAPISSVWLWYVAVRSSRSCDCVAESV